MQAQQQEEGLDRQVSALDQCAWCDKKFGDGENRIPAAGKFIHAWPCAREFALFCFPEMGATLDYSLINPECAT